MRIRLFGLILLCCFHSFFLVAKNDPFSKITVTSKNALFKRDKSDKSLFCLQYKDNVLVTFADSTTIKSDYLEIFVRSKSSEKAVDPKGSELEKVIFKKNVYINKKNKKVYADYVELIVSEKLCRLSGNIKIEQIKAEEKDIPLCTECDRAQIKWDTDEIELMGDEHNRVRTTIELDGKLRSINKSFTKSSNQGKP